MGRVFMNGTNDPFHAADDLLAGIKAKVILVDFHAEATSEKVAMGWHLDGRVTAVLGTHTHIPTADERVLPGGTAYQTDVGMSGPYDSVIGVEKDLVLHRFLTGMPGKFEAAKGNPKMCAALSPATTNRPRAAHSAHHARRISQLDTRAISQNKKGSPLRAALYDPRNADLLQPASALAQPAGLLASMRGDGDQRPAWPLVMHRRSLLL